MTWPFDEDTEEEFVFKEPEVIYLTEYDYDYVNVTVKIEVEEVT